MNKRAAIIITDADYVHAEVARRGVRGSSGLLAWEGIDVKLSPQLLADLRLLTEVATDFAAWYGHGFKGGRPMLANEVLSSAARLRAAIGRCNTARRGHGEYEEEG